MAKIWNLYPCICIVCCIANGDRCINAFQTHKKRMVRPLKESCVTFSIRKAFLLLLPGFFYCFITKTKTPEVNYVQSVIWALSIPITNTEKLILLSLCMPASVTRCKILECWYQWEAKGSHLNQVFVSLRTYCMIFSVRWKSKKIPFFTFRSFLS